jgi:DNA replication initiation complex subunit (GINS family)
MPKEGIRMEKTKKEECIETAMVRMRDNFEKNVEKLCSEAIAKLDGEGEFNIDRLEEIWGYIYKENQKITEELMSAVMDDVLESEIVQKNELMLEPLER